MPRRLRVATKFVETAKRHYADKGIQIDIIKLTGALELAPVMQLAHRIVDIVETGNTLVANGLEPKELICNISSRLIVNKVAYKTKRTLIQTPDRAFGGDDGMMRRLSTGTAQFSLELSAAIDHAGLISSEIHETVAGIIQAVRQSGDQALLHYTEKFDEFKPSSIESLKVSKPGMAAGLRID